MHVVFRTDDFSGSEYELTAGVSAFDFVSVGNSISLPYSGVDSFHFTFDSRQQAWLTLIHEHKIYDCHVIDTGELEPFITTLNKTYGFEISIEVKCK